MIKKFNAKESFWYEGVAIFFSGGENQGFGIRVARSQWFSGGVGFLTTPDVDVGVRFFCPTPEVQLDHLLHHTPKLAIPVEISYFLSNSC